jgi:NAD(P)H-flavin reductase
VNHLESIYQPRRAEIVHSRQLTLREKFFEVRLLDGAPLLHKPGQFVEVSVFGVGEAPISVSSSPTRPGPSFEMCIRNAGNVTGALHRLPAGATIGIRGPFGRGFPVDDLKGWDLLFVAGGLGLVPLRSLINYALDRRAEFGSLTLLYGSRTPADMLFVQELDAWQGSEGFRLETTVDLADASWTGHVGPITKLFNLVEADPGRTVALVVVYLSLERRMKCGVGKCGHCQVDDVYVCQKGPVFPYTRLRKLKEAL